MKTWVVTTAVTVWAMGASFLATVLRAIFRGHGGERLDQGVVGRQSRPSRGERGTEKVPRGKEEELASLGPANPDHLVAGSDPAPPVTLAPPAALTDVERQWSRAWVDAALGVAAAQKVEVDCLAQGWGALARGEAVEGQPLRLGGKTYASGLGTHADSDIRVRTALAAERFHAWVGVDENEKTLTELAAKVAFAVRVGERTVWSCAPRAAADGATEVSVGLGGAREWHLLARTAGEGIRFAHADWVEAVVTLADGTTTDLGQRQMGLGTPKSPPFSFRYGGAASSELVPTWAVTRTSETEAGGVTRHRTMYVDPRTQLECILELREYVDFPAAKWVVRLRNGGRTDTPPLEDIQALDTLWQSSSRTTVCFAKGSDARIDDFQNAVARLPQVGFAGEPLTFVSRGGRPSTAYLPYFNLRDGETGVVIGIGWSGQWAASFAQDVNQDVRVRAGMEKTHLVLRPGEEVRTPSILVLFWQGGPMRGHNLLRQFILHHNAPRKDGKIVQAPLACATWGGQLSSVQVEEIQRASAAGLPFELFWVDAGWFGDGARGRYIPEITGYWYTQAGNWAIDRSIHPDGLVEVSRAARAAGMGMMLWVEPERAVWGTRVTREHPDWFLGGRRAGASVLLDLGEPEARRWATGLVSGLVTELDLAWYRQDFNMDCLEQWRSHDTPDRQGMTEIRYVEGLYAFWDELRRRHPGLMIDNCASGGRRLDLELLARSIPLWRSDYHCPGMEADPIGGQVHTMGLSYWIPLHGTSAAANPLDTYAFRSNLAAALQYWAPPALATDPSVRDWCSTMLAQYQRARPFFYGDYYPLTKTSPQADGWAAIQMHRPDQEQGMMLLLRRTESPFAAAQLTLGGLDPSGTYEFTDADTGTSVRYRGKELLSPTTWSIDTPRASRLIFYRRVR